MTKIGACKPQTCVFIAVKYIGSIVWVNAIFKFKYETAIIWNKKIPVMKHAKDDKFSETETEVYWAKKYTIKKKQSVSQEQKSMVSVVMLSV